MSARLTAPPRPPAYASRPGSGAQPGVARPPPPGTTRPPPRSPQADYGEELAAAVGLGGGGRISQQLARVANKGGALAKAFRQAQR